MIGGSAMGKARQFLEAVVVWRLPIVIARIAEASLPARIAFRCIGRDRHRERSVAIQRSRR